jgi:nitroreductase
MDTLEAVRTIRVVRAFRSETLPREVVDSILNAGRRAGSSKNSQEWAFVVVRERDMLQRLSKAGRYAGLLAHADMAVALVTPEPSTYPAPYSLMWDLGRAAQNMVLAAWSLGVGSCPVTAHYRDRCGEVLGLPPDQACGFILGFGWPKDPADLTRPPKAGGRKSLDEVVHSERW